VALSALSHVSSSHNRPTTSYPPVYTFVTDGEVSAIEQAKSAAAEKVVDLHGATVMQQALPLGPVDAIRMPCAGSERRLPAK